MPPGEYLWIGGGGKILLVSEMITNKEITKLYQYLGFLYRIRN